MIKLEYVEYQEKGYEYFIVYLYIREWFVIYIEFGDEDNMYLSFIYRI